MWDIVLAWWPSFFVIVTLENSGKIRPRSDSAGPQTIGLLGTGPPQSRWLCGERRNSGMNEKTAFAVSE